MPIHRVHRVWTRRRVFACATAHHCWHSKAVVELVVIKSIIRLLLLLARLGATFARLVLGGRLAHWAPGGRKVIDGAGLLPGARPGRSVVHLQLARAHARASQLNQLHLVGVNLSWLLLLLLDGKVVQCGVDWLVLHRARRKACKLKLLLWLLHEGAAARASGQFRRLLLVNGPGPLDNLGHWLALQLATGLRVSAGVLLLLIELLIVYLHQVLLLLAKIVGHLKLLLLRLPMLVVLMMMIAMMLVVKVVILAGVSLLLMELLVVLRLQEQTGGRRQHVALDWRSWNGHLGLHEATGMGLCVN